MRIGRDTDGRAVNRIVNHAAVRPWMVGTPAGDNGEPLDLAPLARDPRHRLLIGEPEAYGAFMCVQLLDGVYEAHAAVMPEGRGQWTLEFAEAALHHLFTATDAVEILTRVPQGHLASLTLVRRLGFACRWSRPSCRFRGRDVPYTVWSLVMQDWFPADDASRETVLQDMLRAGCSRKAAVWHNRFAFLSREALI